MSKKLVTGDWSHVTLASFLLQTEQALAVGDGVRTLTSGVSGKAAVREVHCGAVMPEVADAVSPLGKAGAVQPWVGGEARVASWSGKRVEVDRV